ncbi:MAG: hypothetical protein IKU62_04870 [Ruminiclostridium sp.]|nr:hypothetical protein [Ruminiclostridium sp.]
MSEKAGQFRSVTFGGFHRQDVLDYLEKLAEERKEERELWEAEKAELMAQLQEERSIRNMAENRLTLLESRANESSDARKEMDEAVAALREELTQKDAQLTQAQSQAEELRQQISRLTPEAQSWKRIKDTAGDIEVAAHERAQITIQNAQVQAAEIRAEVIRRVLDVQARCDTLQQDLRTSIQAAEVQLDNIRASFALTETDVSGFQSALTKLVEETEKD